MSKEDDMAEVQVEQGAAVDVDVDENVAIDVEEGEISGSDSVEEITQEDFHKQKQQEEERERKGMSAKTSAKDDPRVWAQLCDLYSKYPTISRGSAPGLYHLAWAQAVQNKPLNDIFVMGGDPKSNETASNSSYTSTSSSSTSSRSPASVNEANLDHNGRDNNFAFTSFCNVDDTLVQKQQNHPKTVVDQVVIDDSDDEKLEPKPLHPEIMEIDRDQDKEEGELEEGEIDLETHTKANDASPSQLGEVVEMGQPDEQQDLPMKQEQGKEGSLSPHTSKEKDLENYLNSIQEALDCVTMVNAEKSFGEACSQMQQAFFSLLGELPKCSLSTKEALINISLNTLELVNSEFQSLNDHQKEEARDSFSRLLCLVKDQGTLIFSPEHMKEIQDMMDSLGSLDSLAILTTTAKDEMEVRSLESDIIVHQQISSLRNPSVPILSGECNSTAPPVVSTVRGRGVLLPLLDLHKDHDADNLPSPTRKVQSSAPLSKASSHGDAPAKLVSTKPKLDQDREDPRTRFYETEALKAVSSYQQRFSRNFFLAGEKLPSPTPSDDCDDGEIDTGEGVSSIPSVGLSKVMRPPPMAQVATSFTTGVNNICSYGPSTFTNTAPLRSGYNSLKTSSKNRDPRLRFVNSDVNSLDLNQCLFPAPQNAPKMENTEIISSRKQKSGDELSSHGPALKKQKNELQSFVRLRDVKTGGWLVDTNVTGDSLTDRSQILEAADANSVKVTGPLTGTSSALNNLNSASIGIEQGPVTNSNATPYLPALLKDVTVNSFMLEKLFKMGQHQRLVGESLHKSFDSAGSKTELSVSNPTLGAVAVVSTAPSTTMLQNSVGAIPFSSQATAGCLSDESTKIRMKPRDPRRILHEGTLQKSGSSGLEQFKSILPPSSSSQSGVDNINRKKMESRTETKSMLSQSVVAADIARQSKNLKNLADIVPVYQAAANLPIPAQNLSSASRSIKSDTDFQSSSRYEDRRAGMIASQESGVAVTPQSQCTWGDFEHLFNGYDEKQKDAIQRERARRIEEQRKMFAARKLCLVLDLDHTLLNSAKFGEVDPVHEDILRKKEEQDREKPLRHLFCFPHMGMWTKLRPGIWNFLEKASKLYELHLYTMGNKLYATEMAKVLDPKGVLFTGRVISKGDDGDPLDGDERVPKSKDLEGVLGMESAVVIIDDSVRVWPHNKLNLIVVERYTYFPCSRRQFGLPGPSLLEIDRDERPEAGTLASSLVVIERIHQNFFAHKTLEEADARNILATEQRNILAGCRIVFSRIFPVGDAKPHLHPLWQTAEQFGAVCTNQIDEQVTHVVANSLGTDKVNWALSTGRYVVHPGWVEASALLYRRANELDFSIKP